MSKKKKNLTGHRLGINKLHNEHEGLISGSEEILWALEYF